MIHGLMPVASRLTSGQCWRESAGSYSASRLYPLGRANASVVQHPSATPVLLIGAGMIAHDQVLPALLQMRREAAIGEVAVCSRRARSTHALDRAPAIRARVSRHVVPISRCIGCGRRNSKPGAIQGGVVGVATEERRGCRCTGPLAFRNRLDRASR